MLVAEQNSRMSGGALQKGDVIFSGDLVFQIRTQLNAMMGLSELLSMEIEDDCAKSYVEEIQQTSNRLRRIVDRVQELSCIQEKAITLDTRGCDMEMLLREVKSICSGRAANKNIKFNVEDATYAGLRVQCDQTRIKRSLADVVSSVIESMPGGELSLLFHLDEKDVFIDISCVCNEQESPLSIMLKSLESEKAVGLKGITDPSLIEIFLVSNLIECLGGSLSVTEKNGAAVLRIILPYEHEDIEIVSKTEVLETVEEENESVDLNGSDYEPKLLLIEDDPRNRLVFELLLKSFNLRVDSAATGQEGLDKARTDSYDIIVSDIRLPDIMGYEISDTLRAEGMSIPILALTAEMHLEGQGIHLEEHFDRVIMKPVDREMLKSVLSQYVPLKEKKK